MGRMYKWILAVFMIGAAFLWLQKRVESVKQSAAAAASGGPSSPAPAQAAGRKNGLQPQTQAPTATPAPVPSKVAADGGRDPAQTPVRSEQEFRDRYPGAWTIRRGAGGRPSTISGGLIPAGARTPADIPRLIQTLAPFLEVDARQVLDLPVQMAGATDVSRSFNLRQTADGLEVFGGIIRVHARSSDGAVYIIDNMTQPVGPYQRAPAVSQQQALGIVQGRYGAGADVRFNRGPVLFGAGPATELAWVFHIYLSSPKRQTLQNVIGATSGRVLIESMLSRE